MTLTLTVKKLEKIILRCQNLFSHFYNFKINKKDRSGVLDGQSSSANSSTTKVPSTRNNIITKPGLFTQGRDSTKQSVGGLQI